MKKLSQSPYNKVLGNIALLKKFNFRLFHSHSPIFPFTSSATKLSLNELWVIEELSQRKSGEARRATENNSPPRRGQLRKPKLSEGLG